MSLVNRAIWFIESHHAEDINLNRVAEAVGVSPYHLIRAFGTATGYSVIRYLRVRRLSIAAQTLAFGHPSNILDVALEAGYGSHEAFTRAFHEQFGVTPEMLRGQGHLNNIELVDALSVPENPHETIPPHRIDNHRTLLVAGLRARYGEDASTHIPSQWQRFMPYMGAMAHQIGAFTYGVGYNWDNENTINYLCGVEVRDFSELGLNWITFAFQNSTTSFSPIRIMCPVSAIAGIMSGMNGFHSLSTSCLMPPFLSVTPKHSIRPLAWVASNCGYPPLRET